MRKSASLSIAVIGSGWSGSGALIDLFSRQSSVSGYPFELDFWRRPKGLRDLESKRELLIFLGNEFFSSTRIIFKTFFKLLSQPLAMRTHMNSFITQLKMVVLIVISLTSAIFKPNIRLEKIKFINRFKSFFGRRGTVFLYDQAVFPEQINNNLGDLNVDACIIVLRDVFDQVQDLLNSSEVLKTSTIRESFFLGANGDFGLNPNSLQLKIILITLRDRIRQIRELISIYPDSFLVIKFEDLVENTDLAISKVNKFLQSKGFPSFFVDSNGAKEVLTNSRKNIGIGSNTHWANQSIMNEINEDIQFIVSRFN